MMNIINLIELLLLVVCFIGLLVQIAKNRAISARVEDYQDDLACAIADHSERLETVERVAGECCNRIQPLVTTLERMQWRITDKSVALLHLHAQNNDGTIILYDNIGRVVGCLSENYLRKIYRLKIGKIDKYDIGVTLTLPTGTQRPKAEVKDDNRDTEVNNIIPVIPEMTQDTNNTENEEVNDTTDGRED